MVKNPISNCCHQSTQIPKIHTLHSASAAPQLPVPGLFRHLHFLQGYSHPCQHQECFFHLGTFPPCFARAFLGLGSGLEEADLADNLASLLWSILHLDFNFLASPSSFLLGTLVTAVGHKCWNQRCSSLQALLSPRVTLASFSRCSNLLIINNIHQV